MTFNQSKCAWTVPSGNSSGSTVNELSTWDHAPAGASDGDYYVYTPTGVMYRYSSTYGCLVRDWVYAGTLALDGRIDGDEDAAQLTADGWALSGTPTTDGTHVTFDAGGGSFAMATFTHNRTDARHYVCGYVTHVSGPSASYKLSNSVGIRTGSYQHLWSSKMTSGSVDHRC